MHAVPGVHVYSSVDYIGCDRAVHTHLNYHHLDSQECATGQNNLPLPENNACNERNVKRLTRMSDTLCSHSTSNIILAYHSSRNSKQPVQSRHINWVRHLARHLEQHHPLIAVLVTNFDECINAGERFALRLHKYWYTPSGASYCTVIVLSNSMDFTGTGNSAANLVGRSVLELLTNLQLCMLERVLFIGSGVSHSSIHTAN
jgi:hypothetical protein